MKKMKSGFTLAEVLITLSVIGIISAIVLPSVIAGYQYKTLGVKLSKFAASLEQASRAYVVGDPFSDISNDRLSAQLRHFVNDAFVITSITGAAKDCSEITNEDDKKTCEKNNPDGDKLSGTVLELSSSVTSGVDGDFCYLPLYKEAGAKTTYSNETKPYTAAILKDGSAVAVSPIKVENINTIAGYYSDSDDIRMKNLIDTYKFGYPVAEVRFDPNVTGLPHEAHQSYYFYITQNGYVVPAINDECVVGIYENEWKASADMFASGGSCGDGGKPIVPSGT